MNREVAIWDVAQRALERRFQIPPPGSLVVLDQGRLLAVGDLAGGVQVYDLETGTMLRRYTGHERAVLGIAVHPKEKVLATASHDGTIKLWPLPAMNEKKD